MSQEELIKFIENTSEEVLTVLTSIKGLLLLSEHYANPPETRSYLIMISTCIAKLEEIIHATKNKTRNG